MILLARYTTENIFRNSAKIDEFSSFWLNFRAGRTNIIVLFSID